jgi:hypothetical protein
MYALFRTVYWAFFWIIMWVSVPGVVELALRLRGIGISAASAAYLATVSGVAGAALYACLGAVIGIAVVHVVWPAGDERAQVVREFRLPLERFARTITPLGLYRLVGMLIRKFRP